MYACTDRRVLSGRVEKGDDGRVGFTVDKEERKPEAHDGSPPLRPVYEISSPDSESKTREGPTE